MSQEKNEKNELTTEDQQANDQTRKQKKEKKKWLKKPRRRIFPIGLRIVFVLLLFAASLMIGLMVGYGVLGDGDPADALKKETWQHIIDIVTKK
ncbi:DNA-directed RNA polymerase subunit beta [Virgibacillus sp. W0181]|uniref:DNA-directed RNA polymerase subunit beta n=1 Tax=Virgibacillus sp. W0181 TaxID=3391581 RepID=UPI003F458DEA